MPFRAIVLRRLAFTLPTLLGVATLVFALLHAIPGDPVDVMLGESATPAAREHLRRDLGLDRPLLEQYSTFLAGLGRGDLGSSIHTRERVTSLVAVHLPMTIALATVALFFAIAVAIPAGLIAAARRGGFADRACLLLSLLGMALPNFWLGPVLVLLFAIELGILPVAGAGGPAHLVLPAVTLGLSMAALLTRMTRSAVLETLHEDYVRTAKAKGASQARVLMRHALGNALTPIVSVIGLQAGSLLAGSVITETIFAWPGLGRLMVDAIRSRDYPVVQGCVLVIAFAYVLVNLATDLAYAWADPRTRVVSGEGG